MGLRRLSSLAITLAVAGAAVVYLSRQGGLGEPPVPSAVAPAGVADVAPVNVEPTLTASVADRTAEQIAAAESFRAMSETFRHTTLLIAIRNAGYVCDDVVEVFQIAEDADAWRARCRDLRAYHLGIDATGALAVEPTADLWDGLYPPSRIEGGSERIPRITPFGPPR